jgi:hypothetical protein
LNDQNRLLTAGKLHIDGFVYDQIDDLASPNAEAQLGWLDLQRRDRFLSQPYEQLAAVFGKMGLEEDKRKVMIAKNKEHATHLKWLPARLRYGLLGILIGYGYRPWRAFWISLIVIGFGWFVFQLGYDWKLVTPTGDKAYVIEKDETKRLKKWEASDFGRLSEIQRVCFLSRDVCASAETGDKRILDSECKAWCTLRLRYAK